MKSHTSLLLMVFGLVKIISSNANPQPCLMELLEIAAFGTYGGSLGPDFSAGYPYGGYPTYSGSPYYGSPYYGASPYYDPYYGSNPYFGGSPYYSGNPYYGANPDYDYDF